VLDLKEVVAEINDRFVERTRSQMVGAVAGRRFEHDGPGERVGGASDSDFVDLAGIAAAVECDFETCDTERRQRAEYNALICGIDLALPPALLGPPR
jgi:hypothetical protein